MSTTRLLYGLAIGGGLLALGNCTRARNEPVGSGASDAASATVLDDGGRPAPDGPPSSRVEPDAAPAGSDGPAAPLDGPADPSARLPAGVSDSFVPKGGSRLKARWIEAADGARSWVGWHDSRFDYGCGADDAADGTVRCMPAVPDYYLPGLFADAACKEPATLLATSAPLPPYVRHADYSFGCRARVRMFPVGARSQARSYRSGSSADGTLTCTESGVPAGMSVHLVGPEVPPTTFPQFREVKLPPLPGAPVDLAVLESDDGARFEIGWRHLGTGAFCDLLKTTDGRQRCMPARALPEFAAFSDPACRGDALPVYGCELPPVTHVARPIPGASCPQTYAGWSVGPMIAEPYFLREGTCSKQLPVLGHVYYPLRTPVADDVFPTIEDKVVDGSTQRLRRRLQVAPGGRAIVSTDWFDSVRQELCHAARTPGGTIRCVPRGESAWGSYSDASCTRPLLATSSGACVPRYGIQYFDDLLRVHTVGPRYTGSVFSDFGSGCRPYEEDPAYPAFFYSMAPIPETDFGEMKQIGATEGGP